MVNQDFLVVLSWYELAFLFLVSEVRDWIVIHAFVGIHIRGMNCDVHLGGRLYFNIFVSCFVIQSIFSNSMFRVEGLCISFLMILFP